MNESVAVLVYVLLLLSIAIAWLDVSYRRIVCEDLGSVSREVVVLPFHPDKEYNPMTIESPFIQIPVRLQILVISLPFRIPKYNSLVVKSTRTAKPQNAGCLHTPIILYGGLCTVATRYVRRPYMQSLYDRDCHLLSTVTELVAMVNSVGNRSRSIEDLVTITVSIPRSRLRVQCPLQYSQYPQPFQKDLLRPHHPHPLHTA